MFVHTLARASGFILAAFALLDLFNDLVRRRAPVSIWWVDLTWAPPPFLSALAACAGILLGAWACRPEMSRGRQVVTFAILGAVLLCAIIDSGRFWAMSIRGIISAAIPIPFSLIVAFVLGLNLWAMIIRPYPLNRRRCRWIAIATGVAVCLIGLPLCRMYLSGKIDHSRPTDAIVVLGARTYADGRPSDALADRVRTGCDLYHRGLAPVLIMSGGPGDGAIHETEAMRTLAVHLGVPDDAILLDREGINTQATAVNIARLFRTSGETRLLAVSHFYHLPRVKLSFSRQGLDVWTVPARETYRLSKMPLLIAREVAATWVYQFLSALHLHLV